MRVLIVDSEPMYAHSTCLFLQTQGYHSDTAIRGEEAIELVKNNEYDIILLDTDVCCLPGIDVFQALRAGSADTPIIVLGTSKILGVKLAAFEAGADDYLTKPYHMHELVARIRSITRRSVREVRTIIQIGTIGIDTNSQIVTVRNRPVPLTSGQYRAFIFLWDHRNRIVSREDLLKDLYDSTEEPLLRSINVLISRLRKSILDAGSPHYIRTVRGLGYCLDAPPLR